MKDLWLEVRSSECFGFLGELLHLLCVHATALCSYPRMCGAARAGLNGAGKTTAIRLMTGEDIPTAGTARLMGKDILENTQQVRQLIGEAQFQRKGMSPDPLRALWQATARRVTL